MGCRGPITDRAFEVDLAADEQPEGDRGVEVSARDAASGRYHDGDGQTVGQRHAQEVHLVLVAGVDCPDPDKDEREGTDSFRDALR